MSSSEKKKSRDKGWTDAHFHLDERILTIEGLLASMDNAGIRKTGLIPCLCPPLALPAISALALPLLRRMIHRRKGAAKALGLALYGNTVKNDGTVDLLGKRYPVHPQPDNQKVADAVCAHPDRFFGYVFINPKGPNPPVEELSRYLEIPGMAAAKAHPFWHGYSLSRLDGAAAFLSQKGVPLLIHLSKEPPSPGGGFLGFVKRHPRLKVIFAHAGLPFMHEVCEACKKMENVFVDISSPAYVDPKTAKTALDMAGPKKLIFGTDGPYFHVQQDRFVYKKHMEMMEMAGLSKEEKQMIMETNIRELIGNI